VRENAKSKCLPHKNEQEEEEEAEERKRRSICVFSSPVITFSLFKRIDSGWRSREIHINQENKIARWVLFFFLYFFPFRFSSSFSLCSNSTSQKHRSIANSMSQQAFLYVLCVVYQNISNLLKMTKAEKEKKRRRNICKYFRFLFNWHQTSHIPCFLEHFSITKRTKIHMIRTEFDLKPQI